VNRIILQLPAEHPSFAGHFPGNPIIPGAVLLDEILAAIERTQGRPAEAWSVKWVKFLQPVRPGDDVALEITAAPGGDTRFRCWIGAVEAITGLVRT
jgi:3-hydroxymyristoyl/3-hydroxydecanoyl-(acyl carrier protein) dehydratase